MEQAFIVEGFRTAVGRAHKGAFKTTRSDDLAVAVIKHLLLSVPEIDPMRIDDLIVGCAYPEGEQGLQMGRLIGLMSLPIKVPGFIVNRFCGSGLESIAIASQRIQSGMADIIIAGGTESMTMIPRNGYKLSPNPDMIRNHPEYLISMGLTAENVAEKYSISRDRQDAFSLSSHKKAIAAIEAGKFKNEIVPITVTESYLDQNEQKHERAYLFDQDEGPRPDTSLEKLHNLQPVFKQNGVVTAGNSSPMNDGASFVLIVSGKILKQLGLKPKLRMVSYAATGVPPEIMGIGPVEAVPLALKKAGLALKDIDLIELNEAFASQSIAVIDQLGLSPEIVNVNGGAIALGHPLGATGTKLTVQLMNEMSRKNSKYGMVTACVGGGQGVAGIFENLQA